MENETEVATLTAEILEIAGKRASVEGLQGNTLSRHKTAINAFEDILNGSRKRMLRPGRWISLYATEDVTSTVISNMKFLAAILEWAVEQDYPDSVFFHRLSRAIRCALAVRAA